MKKRNVLLITIAALLMCASFTACNQEETLEELNSPGISDAPSTEPAVQDTDETAPKAAEPEAAESENNTSEASAEETSVTEETSAAEETETAPDDAQNTETVIITENIGTQSGNDIANSCNTQAGNAVAELAKAQEGKPFYFGGSTPEQGFDNSGLIYYTLNQNGIDCPRVTPDIAAMGDKIGYDEIKAGDVVFFEMNGSGKADFGGIYIGSGQMVIAMSEEYPVRIVDITTNYYRDTFQYGIKIS